LLQASPQAANIAPQGIPGPFAAEILILLAKTRIIAPNHGIGMRRHTGVP
jgi:hypothetical protein